MTSQCMFCQIQLQEDTLGVPDMLEDYLCSHQTKLEVLSQKWLTVLGLGKESFGNTNIYRGS